MMNEPGVGGFQPRSVRLIEYPTSDLGSIVDTIAYFIYLLIFLFIYFFLFFSIFFFLDR